MPVNEIRLTPAGLPSENSQLREAVFRAAQTRKGTVITDADGNHLAVILSAVTNRARDAIAGQENTA